jgi:phage terminase Nu1 subunit (DNA packaging protein)
MSLPKICSRSELAHVLGITTQGVGKAADAGVLKRLGRGEYDLAASVQAYLRYREQHVLQRHGGAGTYSEAKTRKMRADAELAELALSEKAGTVVNFEHTLQEVTRLTSAIKTRSLSLPSRMAPRLVGKTVAEIHDLLRTQVHKDLRSISEMFANAAAEIRAGSKGSPPSEEITGDKMRQ